MNGVEIRPLERTDIHDPAPCLSQAGKEGLGDGDLADDVDLQLFAQGIQRQKLDHASHHDAGVIDEACQSLSGKCVDDYATGFLNFSLIGDVQPHGNQSRGGPTPQRVAVCGLANAGENTVTQLVEVERARFTYSRRCAGHHYCAHLCHRLSFSRGYHIKGC